METNTYNNINQWVYRFKSYYVVWKLLKMTTSKSDIFVFKSYYVVWKLGTEKVYTLSFVLFKSYYVVWKRCSVPITNWMGQSLNRTM